MTALFERSSKSVVSCYCKLIYILFINRFLQIFTRQQTLIEHVYANENDIGINNQ